MKTEESPEINFVETTLAFATYASATAESGIFRVPFSLSEYLYAGLTNLSTELNVRWEAIFSAALSIVVSRYSGVTRLVIGADIGAEDKQSHQCTWNFSSILINVSRETSFVNLVVNIDEQMRNTSTVPLDLMKLSGSQTSRATPPQSALPIQIFLCPFTAQDRAYSEGLESAYQHSEPSGVSALRLTFRLSDAGASLNGALEYEQPPFISLMVEQLFRHIENIVEAGISAPESNVCELALMGDKEIEQLLSFSQGVDIAFEEDRCVSDLLSSYSKQSAETVAVTSGNDQLTFSELDEAANQLSNYLCKHGVVRGKTVAIFHERSVSLLVAILAIWKAGGAYVPLDLEWPKERIADILNDACPSLVITQSYLCDRLPVSEVPVVSLDTEAKSIEAQLSGATGVRLASSDLAYIIYTSGSTGRPKGVMVTHGSVTNFLLAMDHHFCLNTQDRLCAVTPLSFDISVLEMFLPLLRGGTVVILPPDITMVGMKLRNSLADHGATLMQATPATWRLLLNSAWTPPPGFKILCGGETMPPDLAAAFLALNAQVTNLYGPTEATVWSTIYQLKPNLPPLVPVGRPIANTQIYVLDHEMQFAPVGVVGELYIGGKGVACGYLNRPGLTAAQFVSNKITPNSKGRLYRTGDLARWRPDGELEYVGRNDHQVKLRGYRLELGEIEAAIGRCHGVSQAVAIVHSYDVEDQRLVAFFEAKPNARVPTNILRKQMAAILPHYMIPSTFIAVDGFPLTPNGKIDRSALKEYFIASLR